MFRSGSTQCRGVKERWQTEGVETMLNPWISGYTIFQIGKEENTRFFNSYFLGREAEYLRFATVIQLRDFTGRTEGGTLVSTTATWC